MIQCEYALGGGSPATGSGSGSGSGPGLQHGVLGTGADSIYSIHLIHSSRRASSPLGPHPLNRTRRIPPLQCVSSHSAFGFPHYSLLSPVLPWGSRRKVCLRCRWRVSQGTGSSIRAAGMRLRGRLRVGLSLCCAWVAVDGRLVYALVQMLLGNLCSSASGVI